MNNLRRDFERFCYRNKNKGIPNLMLFVILGNVMVYIFSQIDPSEQLVESLYFIPSAILQGQVWRFVTYIFIPGDTNILFFAIMLFFYFQIGRILESQWGTFRFNLYYFTGVILTGVAALLLNISYASASYLNMSLILAFATMMPENKVLLFYIIPIKMKYFAWFTLIPVIITMFTASLPVKIFVVMALANYFLFMGAEVKGILPSFMLNYRRSQKQSAPKNQGNPNWANKYRNSSGEAPYRHKCTVCGKTDTQYPELEFRYCSQCDGYHCYCMEHINNHDHIK
ncbi:MAG: rhomboid family intramembrane serine protease [Eubacteriales bacterium]